MVWRQHTQNNINPHLKELKAYTDSPSSFILMSISSRGKYLALKLLNAPYVDQLAAMCMSAIYGCWAGIVGSSDLFRWKQLFAVSENKAAESNQSEPNTKSDGTKCAIEIDWFSVMSAY